MGWMTESQFGFQLRERFSLLDIETSSGANLVSYTMQFPWGQSGRGMMLTTHLQLVLRLRLFQSLGCFHGTVLNNSSPGITLPCHHHNDNHYVAAN
jgi:hypothetical protein